MRDWFFQRSSAKCFTPILTARKKESGPTATHMKRPLAKRFERLENGHAPRDLYDVVNLFRHTERRPTASAILDVLRQKCDHKSIAVPTFESILPHRQMLDVTWSQMLAHQLPVLPPLEEFWNALPEIFLWLMSGRDLPQPAILHPSATETVVRTRVLPSAVPLQSRSALEAIRFAAATQAALNGSSRACYRGNQASPFASRFATLYPAG